MSHLFRVKACGTGQILEGEGVGRLHRLVSSKLTKDETGVHGYHLDTLRENVQGVNADVEAGRIAKPKTLDEYAEAVVKKYRAVGGKGKGVKTELRAVAHSIVPGQTIFEVWHNGQFIATIAGADGPGVRIVSKHPLHAAAVEVSAPPNVVEVRIIPEEAPRKNGVPGSA